MNSPQSPLSISRPIILLDENKTRNNISRMADKARRNHTTYRPHFKTHQSAQIGSWFKDYGVNCITVSSVEMAAYFREAGWSDICIAFPVNVLQLMELDELAGKAKLYLMVDSPEAVRALRDKLDHPVNLWLNIDTGQAREGLDPENLPAIRSVLEEMKGARQLHFEGILSHFGHSYSARGKEAITTLYRLGMDRIKRLISFLESEGWKDLQISIGDTPCCSLVDDLHEADEIRPGTCVFYDKRQEATMACSEEDIAIAAACPVIGVYPHRGEVAIYGGAAHLSKDFNLNPDGERNYGAVTRFTGGVWYPSIPESYLATLTQEIGLVKMPANELEKTRVGDVLLILPAHACLLVNTLRHYLTLGNEPIACMPIFYKALLSEFSLFWT